MKENKNGAVYQALILNNYAEAPYADWVKQGVKKIETRMNRVFRYRGDIIICCGKTNSVGPNRGLALCMVDLWKGRAMIREDEDAAMIDWGPGRKSLLLKNWRHFSRDFEFSPQYVSGAFQSIFQITIPDDVEIIPRPDIIPYSEIEYNGRSTFI